MPDLTSSIQLTVLVPLTLFILVQRSASLSCAICRHTDLSQIPKDAPYTLMVFDAKSDQCDEDIIECPNLNDFCMVAAAPSERNHYVQKGCVSTSERSRGYACQQKLLTIHGDEVPLTVGDQNLDMTICLCNTHDMCNAGRVSALSRPRNMEIKDSKSHHLLINSISVLSGVFITLYFTDL